MMRRFTPLMFVALVSLAGCGPRLVPVSGTVTMDNKPVAGATVIFTSEDGKYTSNGLTDESGNFSLKSPAGEGAYPGNYKVTVTKYPKIETDMSPASKEYAKQMTKEAEVGKAAGAPKIPKGSKMPPMPMPGASTMASGAKSELPAVYATIEKTPLTAKVPADGPVELQLKSKP
jgi:hypothetical protein